MPLKTDFHICTVADDVALFSVQGVGTGYIKQSENYIYNHIHMNKNE